MHQVREHRTHRGSGGSVLRRRRPQKHKGSRVCAKLVQQGTVWVQEWRPAREWCTASGKLGICPLWRGRQTLSNKHKGMKWATWLLKEALTSQLDQEVKGRNVGPIETVHLIFQRTDFGRRWSQKVLCTKCSWACALSCKSLESVGSCNISFSQLTAVQAQVGGAV